MFPDFQPECKIATPAPLVLQPVPFDRPPEPTPDLNPRTMAPQSINGNYGNGMCIPDFGDRFGNYLDAFNVTPADLGWLNDVDIPLLPDLSAESLLTEESITMYPTSSDAFLAPLTSDGSSFVVSG